MNIRPTRSGRLFLALLPFVLLAIIYVLASAERRAVNPDDKLLPPVSEMVDSVRRLAFDLGIATLIGLACGLAIGVLPIANAAFAPLVAVLSMIPPMAVLPVLFI